MNSNSLVGFSQNVKMKCLAKASYFFLFLPSFKKDGNDSFENSCFLKVLHHILTIT